MNFCCRLLRPVLAARVIFAPRPPLSDPFSDSLSTSVAGLVSLVGSALTVRATAAPASGSVVVTDFCSDTVAGRLPESNSSCCCISASCARIKSCVAEPPGIDAGNSMLDTGLTGPEAGCGSGAGETSLADAGTSASVTPCDSRYSLTAPIDVSETLSWRKVTSTPNSLVISRLACVRKSESSPSSTNSAASSADSSARPEHSSSTRTTRVRILSSVIS